MSQHRRFKLRASAIAAALASVLAFDAHANLISDGSFEGNGVHTPNNGSYGQGSTYIDGWTVFTRAAGNSVQWIANNSYYAVSAFDGNGLLDLTGNADIGFAGVQQSFSSTLGTTYRATFYLGYSRVDQGYGGPVGLNVSINDDSSSNQVRAYSAGTSTDTNTGSVWTQFTYDFTATSASTLLRFEGTAGSHFVGLDAIDVELGPVAVIPPVIVPAPNGTVPEPAPIALLGIGIVGGLFARRRASEAKRA